MARRTVKYRGYKIEPCYGDNYCIAGPGIFDRIPLVNLKTAKKYIDLAIIDEAAARARRAARKSR